MSDRIVLVLDQSLSSTGFALLREGSAVLTGSWHLCDSSGNRALGFRELWSKLDAMHKGYGLDLIVHEKPSFGAANKGEDQLIGAVGMVAIIELFTVSRSIRIASYASRSWRSTFFTRTERKIIAAKPTRLRDWKRPAILRARQLGFDPASHDEAEAIGIADYHLLKNKTTPEWRAGDLLLESVA